MSASDVSETVTEISDEIGGPEIICRERVAIFISILAVILAITSMGGGNSTKDMMNSNIVASNTYSFYQAKTIRSTTFKVALEDLQLFKAAAKNLPEDVVAMIDKRIDAYQKTIDRYESEPGTGEGRKELLTKAAVYEAIRDHAGRQDPYFDYGEALLEIAIVLASVSMVAQRRWVLWLSYGFALTAIMLAVNAFFLLVDFL